MVIGQITQNNYKELTNIMEKRRESQEGAFLDYSL